MGYVILVPVALFLVMLAVQAAVYFHAANIAQHAGARAVAVASRRGADVSTGQREAETVVRDSGSTLVAASVVGGDLVRASVTVQVSRVVPFFPAAVTRHAAAPRERFVPEDQR